MIRIIYSLLLIGLLLCTGGCMSSHVVKRAKGYTTDLVDPRKGDTLISHDGFTYVIQQKHPQPDTTGKMTPTELQKYPRPYYNYDPCPGCYSLLVVTAPMDVMTLPFQAIGYGLAIFLYSNASHF